MSLAQFGVGFQLVALRKNILGLSEKNASLNNSSEFHLSFEADLHSLIFARFSFRLLPITGRRTTFVSVVINSIYRRFDHIRKFGTIILTSKMIEENKKSEYCICFSKIEYHTAVPFGCKQYNAKN